jgi:hypothetical protein
MIAAPPLPDGQDHPGKRSIPVYRLSPYAIVVQYAGVRFAAQTRIGR